jgi:hypothetical protein
LLLFGSTGLIDILSSPEYRSRGNYYERNMPAMPVLFVILILLAGPTAFSQEGIIKSIKFRQDAGELVWARKPDPMRIPRGPTRVSLVVLVKDKDGASLQDAEVTVTNLKTDDGQTTTTNKEGVVRVCNLPRGKYKITANSPGYSEVKTTIMMPTKRTPPLSLTLKFN